MVLGSSEWRKRAVRQLVTSPADRPTQNFASGEAKFCNTLCVDIKPKTKEFLNFLLWTASGGTLAANVQGSTKVSPPP